MTSIRDGNGKIKTNVCIGLVLAAMLIAMFVELLPRVCC